MLDQPHVRARLQVAHALPQDGDEHAPDLSLQQEERARIRNSENSTDLLRLKPSPKHTPPSKLLKIVHEYRMATDRVDLNREVLQQ